MSPSEKQAYILERGSVAMFTAAHRERLNIVRHLCEKSKLTHRLVVDD